VDAAGNLYVADFNNSRVLEYNTPLTTDTVADRVFGQAGSFTSGTCNLGGVSASSLCNPFGVAVDAAGNLYVADFNNHRVLEYDTPLTTDTVADRVFGQAGSFTSGTCNLGGVSASSLCRPLGVGLDGADNLYVADGNNHRVLEYDSPLAAAQTDVSVSKSAAPNPALMLNPLTYTVTVNNGGPSGATGVTLTDTLPGAVTYGSATPSQGSCGQALGVVTCALGSIANGGNATVSIVVTPTTGNSLINTAAVSGNEPDPNSANNTVTITTPALWQCTKSDSTVVYRGWPSPAGDSDCDGFSDTIENFVGTDPLVACGGTALPDGSSSTWPPDLNNDTRANISDVLKYSPVFNTTGPGLPYLKRYDLNGDNRINISDVLKFSPFFNQSCAP
jgi:uncharacterized repeat protein (TIGR01451 family)